MRKYLDRGYKLLGESGIYLIDSVLGEGATCIAYTAYDKNNSECVIKEYYPTYFMIDRDENGQIIDTDKVEEKFREGLERFENSISEQITLRNNTGTTNQTYYVVEQFRANNTSYSVVPAQKGTVYTDNEEISLYDRLRVCKSVAEFVNKCHLAGYLCLDIKPSNIFIIPETPELTLFFDFDSFVKLEEVIKGKCLSYSESWAAPEQMISGEYRKISKSTDIYTLGELIFWSIFNRHSYEGEHRRNSIFRYEESEYADILNDCAEETLNEIFHNTIRSSIKNRYSSIEPLLNRLNVVIKELYPAKEKLIDLLPPMVPFFTGREQELTRIEALLMKEHKAFIIGMGGIGKSEIAKQYVWTHHKEYRNIVYLTYSFDLVTMINNGHFVKDYDQKEKETDVHYCNRKLDVLTSTLDNHSLVVIDNLNVEIEDLDYKEIWNRIVTLPCDLIVTSRCKQEDYNRNTIFIDEMQNYSLQLLYSHFATVTEDQNEFVDKIINMFHGHTLIVELIAKQARVSCRTPENMYKDLVDKGLLGLEDEIVKWNNHKNTMADHVRRLFSSFNMIDTQKRLMIAMAFMPIEGVDQRLFIDFFDIPNHVDIEFLIDNGWLIGTQNNGSRVISVHPVIASAVIDTIREDNYVEYIFGTGSKRISGWFNRKDFDRKKLVPICRSIAVNAYKHKYKIIALADYLVFLCGYLSAYLNNKEKIDLMKRAIEIYDAEYPKEEYAAVREKAYSLYARYLEPKAGIDLCEKHIKLAKKNKDLYMEVLWYEKKASISKKLKEEGIDDFPIMRVWLIGMVLLIGLSSKKKSLFSEKKMDKFHYGYLKSELLGWQVFRLMAAYYEEVPHKDVFYAKNDFSERVTYKEGARIRGAGVFRYKEGYYNIDELIEAVDLAKLDILYREYKKAIERLNNVIHTYDDNIPYMFVVHDMIGNLYLITKEYDKAIDELLKSIEFVKENNITGTLYETRIKLSQAYLYSGELEKAKEINRELLLDLKEVDIENRDTYYAETLYNIACLSKMKNNSGGAKTSKVIVKYLNVAQQFLDSNAEDCKIFVGVARCDYQIGLLELETDKAEAIKSFQEAYDSFLEYLGENHPETIECKQILDKCKQEI